MRDLFLILFGIILFFLPLSSDVSGTGNDWTIALGIVLLAFYFSGAFLQKNRSPKSSLQTSLILSLIFLYTLLSRIIGNINGSQILHWLVIIWLIPFIGYLRHQYSKQVLIYLILGILTLHAQWAIGQFVVQHDLRFSLLGESRLSSSIPAVAKFAVSDTKLIRAYGPYPHSNALAGSLAIGLQVLLVGGLGEVLFMVLFLGLLVSFSRSAYISVGITLLILLAQNKWPTFAKNMILPMLITTILFTPLLTARFTDARDQAIQDRITGLAWYREIISTQSVWHGLGPGNYQVALQNYLTKNHIAFQPWEIAPVHNALLLFLTEWGIVASGLTAVTLLWASRNIPKKSPWFMLSLAPLLLTDHYLITQVAPLVWAMIAVAVVE